DPVHTGSLRYGDQGKVLRRSSRLENAHVSDHHLRPRTGEATLCSLAISIQKPRTSAKIQLPDKASRRLLQHHKDLLGVEGNFRRTTGTWQPGLRFAVAADHRGIKIT